MKAAHAANPERAEKQGRKLAQWYVDHPDEAAAKGRKISESRKGLTLSEEAKAKRRRLMALRKAEREAQKPS